MSSPAIFPLVTQFRVFTLLIQSLGIGRIDLELLVVQRSFFDGGQALHDLCLVRTGLCSVLARINLAAVDVEAFVLTTVILFVRLTAVKPGG